MGERIALGSISQLRGGAGCVSERGKEGCAVGRGLAGAGDIAISPDGRNAYAAANNSGAVVAFTRASGTGRLVQLAGSTGCTSEGGVDGCAIGTGLSGAFSVALSPDDRNVYVATYNGIAVFLRDPRSGALIQLPGATGCVSSTGGEGCAAGRALDSVAGVAVSPDGANVYVASAGSGAVAAFKRDPSTGAVTQLGGAAGCTSEGGAVGCAPARALNGAFSIAVTPNGKDAYVAALDSNSIVALSRDPQTGALTQLPGAAGCTSEGGVEGCATGRGLAGPNAVLATRDGGYVYAASSASSAVVAFQIDPYTGELIQLVGAAGCTSRGGTEGCATGRALGGAFALAASSDGNTIYVASLGAVAAFLRNPADGSLDELAGTAGCTVEGGSEGCARGRGLAGTSSVTVSPDGRNVYGTALQSGAVSAFSREPLSVHLGLRISGIPRACVRRALVVRAAFAGTLPLRVLEATLDRRVIRTTRRTPLVVRIRVTRLGPGRHRLLIRAWDAQGDSVQRSSVFSRCAR
ncbi:MAG: lactonase family protein [Actinomycetota bacterium]|nr:lactonase family protein [Actinomycetota bacterium]